MPLSKKHVTALYRKMLLQSKQGTPSPLEDYTNCYICPECTHIIKTVDVEHGTTPAFHRFDTCDCLLPAQSTFYNDKKVKDSPTHEWFRPSLAECIEMRKKEPGLLDHILQGGLDVRKVKAEKEGV